MTNRCIILTFAGLLALTTATPADAANYPGTMCDPAGTANDPDDYYDGTEGAIFLRDPDFIHTFTCPIVRETTSSCSSSNINVFVYDATTASGVSCTFYARSGSSATSFFWGSGQTTSSFTGYGTITIPGGGSCDTGSDGYYVLNCSLPPAVTSTSGRSSIRSYSFSG